MEVNLSTPWPPNSSEEASEKYDGGKKHGKLVKRPTITVLTGEVLMEKYGATAIDDDDDLMDTSDDRLQ